MNMRGQSISMIENLDFPNCQLALRFVREMPVILSSGDAISGQVTRMMQKGATGLFRNRSFFMRYRKKSESHGMPLKMPPRRMIPFR